MSEGQTVDAAPRRGIDRIVAWVALAGGVLLIAVAAMVVVSVTLRSDLIGWAGIPGDFEMVQMATAICAFAFLPLCQLRRGNIFVDTFTLKLPSLANRMIDAMWDIVYALAMALISWRLTVGALSAYTSGENSMVLRFPAWLPITACAALAALVAAVSVVTAMRIAGRKS